MKVYIACAFAFSARAMEIARAVVAAGHHVVSSWHTTAPPGSVDPSSSLHRAVCAETNIEDLHAADLLIADTTCGNPRATFGEIGFMLGLGQPVIWITGRSEPCRNIFTDATLVSEVDTLYEAITTLMRDYAKTA